MLVVFYDQEYTKCRSSDVIDGLFSVVVLGLLGTSYYYCQYCWIIYISEGLTRLLVYMTKNDFENVIKNGEIFKAGNTPN